MACFPSRARGRDRVRPDARCLALRRGSPSCSCSPLTPRARGGCAAPAQRRGLPRLRRRRASRGSRLRRFLDALRRRASGRRRLELRRDARLHERVRRAARSRWRMPSPSRCSASPACARSRARRRARCFVPTPEGFAVRTSGSRTAARRPTASGCGERAKLDPLWVGSLISADGQVGAIVIELGFLGERGERRGAARAAGRAWRRGRRAASSSLWWATRSSSWSRAATSRRTPSAWCR